jgi:hypothetical protein
VFVVQEDSKKNVVQALDFGSIEFILGQRDQVTFSSRPWVDKIKTVLRDFTADDYILAIGDPVAIGVACAVAAAHTGQFKMLKWDRMEQRYYPVVVEIFPRKED